MFSFFSLRYFLKEIKNAFSVFLSSYRTTRESLGELGKAVETRTRASVPTVFLLLPNFHSCFYLNNRVFLSRNFRLIVARGNLMFLRWLKTVSSNFQDVDFDGSSLPLFINWCYNHGTKKFPNHWWTRWYYFHYLLP